MNSQSFEQSHPNHYWLATDAEADHMASHLGISLTQGNARELSANFSRVFLLSSNGDAQRVFKIRARWMTEGRIRFEHALAGHMRDYGLPMVALLVIEDNSTWAKVEDFYCEIAPFISGREIKQTLTDVRQMGTLLGHFHRCSRDFNLNLYEPPHFQNQAEPRDLETWVEQLCHQTSEMQAEDIERINAICARWGELGTLYRKHCTSLPSVIRHGDFHPWNMLFSHAEPSSIVALFDLDMAAKGPRMYDISYAIFFLRNLFPEQNRKDWDTRYQKFIQGYTDTSGMSLSVKEIAVVPILIECIALHFVLQQTTSAGIQGVLNKYEEYSSIVDWLESHDIFFESPSRRVVNAT